MTLSFTATQAGEQITRENISWSTLDTVTLGLTNADWAKKVMDTVKAGPETIAAANQQTDNFAITAATPDTSELVVKILGIITSA